MDRLRSLGIVGIAMLLLLTTGAGGVATISAEQSAGLAVPAESETRLGAEATDPTLGPGIHESVPVLQLTNRFEQPVAVDVTVEGDGPSPPVVRGHDAPDRLGVGERGTVTVAIDCYASPGGSTETWTVEVSATGDGTGADTTRSVAVTCSGEE